MSKGAYIGVDNVARKIKKGYIGVDGIARRIKKAYIGIGGVAKLCYRGKAVFDYISKFPLAGEGSGGLEEIVPYSSWLQGYTRAFFVGGEFADKSKHGYYASYHTLYMFDDSGILTQIGNDNIELNPTVTFIGHNSNYLLIGGGEHYYNISGTSANVSGTYRLLRLNISTGAIHLVTGVSSDQSFSEGASASTATHAIIGGGDLSNYRGSHVAGSSPYHYSVGTSGTATCIEFPNPRRSHTGCTADTLAIFAGGDIDTVDIIKGKSTIVGNSLTISNGGFRRNIGAVSMHPETGGYALFAGGVNEENGLLADVDVFTPSGTKLQNLYLQEKNSDVTGIQIGGHIIFSGGREYQDVTVFNEYLTRIVIEDIFEYGNPVRVITRAGDYAFTLQKSRRSKNEYVYAYKIDKDIL